MTLKRNTSPAFPPGDATVSHELSVLQGLEPLGSVVPHLIMASEEGPLPVITTRVCRYRPRPAAVTGINGFPRRERLDAWLERLMRES